MIDQSFVHDIPGDPNGIAITRTALTLGDSLQLTAVAEGVETEAQLEVLRAEN